MVSGHSPHEVMDAAVAGVSSTMFEKHAVAERVAADRWLAKNINIRRLMFVEGRFWRDTDGASALSPQKALTKSGQAAWQRHANAKQARI